MSSFEKSWAGRERKMDSRHPQLRRALLRYTKDWSARIDFLKQTLNPEGFSQSVIFQEQPAPAQEPVRAQATMAAPVPPAREQAPDNPEKTLMELERSKFFLEELKRLDERQGGLVEEFKRFQGAVLHEIRQQASRAQKMEEFVQARDIELQNLKSDAVAARLIEKEHFEGVDAQVKKISDIHFKLQKDLQSHFSDTDRVLQALSFSLQDLKPISFP